jgi:hypothetical protein
LTRGTSAAVGGLLAVLLLTHPGPWAPNGRSISGTLESSLGVAAAPASVRATLSASSRRHANGGIRVRVKSTAPKIQIRYRTRLGEQRRRTKRTTSGVVVLVLPSGARAVYVRALKSPSLRGRGWRRVRLAPRSTSPTESSSPSISPSPTGGVNPLVGVPQLPWFGGPSWYGKFPKSGAWNDPEVFPIGVWWNVFANDAEVKWDKSVGLNFYVQLSGREDASLLGGNGMFWVGERFGSLSDDDPAWVGNFLEDEVDGQYPDVNDAYSVIEQMLRESSEGRFDANNYTAIVTSSYNEAQRVSSEKFTNMISGPVSVDAYYYTGEWCRTSSEDYRNYQLGGFDQAHCATSASYGQTMRALRVRDMADGVAQPLFSFVESGAPYENGRSITPDQMKGAVWNSIIAGANGILWFPQSFSGDCVTGSSVRLAQYGLQGGCANDNILNGMKVVNLQVQALAPVLNTPSYDVTFGSNLDTMLKWHGDSAYIFAMISGESSSRPGRRTLTLPSALADASTVEVVNEGRDIAVVGGTFTDDFQQEYTYHIYKVTP